MFWEQAGRHQAAITGPESRWGLAPVPGDGQFVGVQFAVGTSLNTIATSALVNGGLELSDVTRRSFSLAGMVWETRRYDNVEDLVHRLVRRGVVIRDPVVVDVLSGGLPDVTSRTLERRFRRATGLTHGAVRQIARARSAAEQLAAGVPVADVAHAHGFFDELHLARALARFVGRTSRSWVAGPN